jgi:hypothetical protein
MLSNLRDSFALARFADGGVAIDLGSGTYSRLNETAAEICQILFRSEDLEVAISLAATELCVDLETATEAVHHVMAALRLPGPRRIRPDPFTYAPAIAGLDGYVLSDAGAPKIWISADGRIVRKASPDQPVDHSLFDYLRVVAPRLLFLQGAAVLHGSACKTSTGAFAVCGDSGAGKTTTARAFDLAGAKLVAEDMLVIASPSPLRVYLGGESAIRNWATRTTAILSETHEADTAGLNEVFEGPELRIPEIWFIAADKRAEDSDQIAPRRLGVADGTLATMGSLFLGATTAPEWRRFLDLAGTIATTTALFETRMPRGLERLKKAAELYTRNSA